MSGFVRSSHYRHVFVDPPKVENTYKGFRLATVTGEQQYIKGNTKFFAVALQGGGGPFAVVPYGKKGQFAPGTPVVAGHKSAVLDFDFNPFHEHIIASASEDSTIKVTLLRFHPTANNVLGSVSGDFSVKVWDIEKGCEM
ncbi:coronin, actin binding protein [Aureococcus anophagefferens]|uniref:Coronin, actin binding protein n=1 Tax=Aureococcus anophagefferens TaxID=44056 RepID=A0ABR1G100_AURAN